MTYYEIIVANRNDSDQWRWSVVRIATVSDTESIIAGGTESTGKAALGKAEAWVEDFYKVREQGGLKPDEVEDGCYRCCRCKSVEEL